MLRRCAPLFALLLLPLAGCVAMTGEPPARGPAMRALPPAEGRALLATDDGYDAVLTPYDLANFVRPNLDGEDRIYRYFIDAVPRAAKAPQTFIAEIEQRRRGAVQPWTDLEMLRLDALEDRHRDILARLRPWLPSEIGHLKASTDRALEFGMPHTRHNAIIWGPRLPDRDADLDQLFLHELFHILSRHNKTRRSELYALIGFDTCTSVDMPPELLMRRMPNPDAPHDHYVLPLPGKAQAVLPRLAWNRSFFDLVKSGESRKLDLEFLVVERAGESCRVQMTPSGEPERFDPADGIALIQKAAGSASSYYKHPEELLADNFAMLFGHAQDVDRTAIERLNAWLEQGP